MGMGGGVGGTQELSLKESKRRRMGKREDTKKDGHQVGRLLLPTPTLYISLLLPATSSVFQFERHTACTNPKRSSSCTGSRSLGRWLAERKRTVAGCLAVCAPLSSPWYVPHIPRRTTSATDILFFYFVFFFRFFIFLPFSFLFFSFLTSSWILDFSSQ